MKQFKLPRFSDGSPNIQNIRPIGTSIRSAFQGWDPETAKARLQTGTLVVWEPTGIPGLWEILSICHVVDVGDLDYSQLERRILAQADREFSMSGGKKVKVYLPPPGKVRLKWIGGWSGYANDGHTVIIKIDEIRRPTALEALALAAS